MSDGMAQGLVFWGIVLASYLVRVLFVENQPTDEDRR